MSLAHAELESLLRVVFVRTGAPLSRRLMELGLVEGAEVRVIRRAPLGDPLQVRLGDYELSLRSSEAALIEVSAA